MKPFSFIIITYNRPADMLALAANICSLHKAGELLEEVIILNNHSTADYSGLKKFLSANPQIPFRYMESEENLGVAKGRNYAIRQSRAPILIMLDDDAELENSDALENLLYEFRKAEKEERPRAIVSFKVIYYENRQMQVNALPHKNFPAYRDKSFFLTYYYAGGAHAITRESLDKVGLYPEDFFYGMEEYDLSYRLIESGYSISYTDKVVMLHKESPHGRQPKNEKVRMMWVNKTKVAWRYLPVRYFFSTAGMWSLEYLRRTGFHVAGFIQGWKEISAIRSREQRTPVGKDAMAYLRKVKARLWY